MPASRHEGGLHIAGPLTCTSLSIPAGTIRDADVAAGAGIGASKTIHRVPISVELAESATAIVAVTKLLHIVRGSSAVIVGFEAAIVTKATDVSRTVSVDLKKGNAGGAYATVLTGTIGFTDASVDRTAVAGVINSPNLADGDSLQVVVAVAGGAGNQAKGLIVTLTIDETP